MLPSDEERLRKWLRTTPYMNQERTMQDITRTVGFYRGLAIKFEPYVMANGRSLTLVSLQGVIPVTIQGNTYNIPVSIWLMDTYPNHAPVCYVKPTADMQIKVSMYVDHNGKIYLPYLHDWTPNQSDLLGLIQVMICTFGEQPPVYSKPKTETTAATPYPTQPPTAAPHSCLQSCLPKLSSSYKPFSSSFKPKENETCDTFKSCNFGCCEKYKDCPFSHKYACCESYGRRANK